MRRWFALLAGIELLLALCACGGAQPPAAELSSSSAEKKAFGRSLHGRCPATRCTVSCSSAFWKKRRNSDTRGHVLGLDRETGRNCTTAGSRARGSMISPVRHIGWATTPPTNF